MVVEASLVEPVLSVPTNQTGIITPPTAAGRTRAVRQRTSVAEPARRAREPPVPLRATVGIVILAPLLDNILRRPDRAFRAPVWRIRIRVAGA